MCINIEVQAIEGAHNGSTHLVVLPQPFDLYERFCHILKEGALNCQATKSRT
jgi:hypothetical protein